MKQKTLEFLESHQSETPSHWRDDAMWRRENREWLRYSQSIALLVLDYLHNTGTTQKELAERMDCSQQCVSKILKGNENLSLETLAKLERATGEKLIAC